MIVFNKDKLRSNSRGYNQEIFFFLLFTFFTYLKFSFLEDVVTPSIARSYMMRAAACGISLCLAAVLSILHRRVRPAAALIVSFSLSVLAVTDILYMRYFADMFTFHNIALASQVMEISSSVLELLRAADFLWFLDIPLLLGYMFTARRLSVRSVFQRLTMLRAALAIFVFAVGSLVLFNHLSIYSKKIPGALTSMWNRPAVANNVGAMTYHVVDAWNIAGGLFRKGHISEDKIKEISSWFSNKTSPVNDLPMFGIAEGKNLIVVQVESLQDFVIGLKLGGQEITPNLNKFVRESVYFSSAYNQTGSGNSSDAEFLVNTGLFPASNGVAFTRFAANKFNSLPKLLVDSGYATLALHGDRPGFWNRNNMYPTLGFERFVSRFNFAEDEIIGMGISDKSFFRQSLEILAEESQPFYAFLVTLTSHHPFDYALMLEQTKLDTGEFSGRFIGNYLTSMRYADEQLGMFLQGLRAKGLFDNSVIVIYGDHSAVPPSSRPHLEKLVGRDLSSSWAWRSMNKVPLIVHVPAKKRISYADNNPAGLVDVAYTIASLLGLNYDSGFGGNLFVRDRAEPVIFSRGSYIMGEVYVEPALERATDINGGRARNYAEFSRLTAEVEKRLAYSNSILEHDLMPRLSKIKTSMLAKKEK